MWRRRRPAVSLLQEAPMLRSRTRTLTVALSTTIITACAPDVTDVELVLARSPSLAAAKYAAWSAPVWLGPIVNSISNEQNAQLSKDGLSLYFSSNRAGGQGGLDIYVAQRSSLDSPWGPATNVAALNSPQADFAPNVSIDGHLLFFASARAGGHGGPD